MKKKEIPTIIFAKEDLTNKKLITQFLLQNEIAFTPKANVYQEYEAVIKVNSISPLNRNKRSSLCLEKNSFDKKIRNLIDHTENTESTALCTDSHRSFEANLRLKNFQPFAASPRPQRALTQRTRPEMNQCLSPFSYKNFSKQVALMNKNKSVTPEKKRTPSKSQPKFNVSYLNKSLTPTNKSKPMLINKKAQPPSKVQTKSKENSLKKPSPKDEKAYIDYLCKEGLKYVQIKDEEEAAQIQALLREEVSKVLKSFDTQQDQPEKSPRHEENRINKAILTESCTNNYQQKSVENLQNETINSSMYSFENYHTFSRAKPRQVMKKGRDLSKENRKEIKLRNQSDIPKSPKFSVEKMTPTKGKTFAKKSMETPVMGISQTARGHLTFRGPEGIQKRSYGRTATWEDENSDFSLQTQSSVGNGYLSKYKTPVLPSKGTDHFEESFEKIPKKEAQEKMVLRDEREKSKSPNLSFELPKNNKSQIEGISLPPCEMNIQFKSARMRDYFAKKCAMMTEAHKNDLSTPRSLNSQLELAYKGDISFVPSEDLEIKHEPMNVSLEHDITVNDDINRKTSVTEDQAVKAKDFNHENEVEKGKIVCKSTCHNSQVSSLAMLQEKDSFSVKSQEEDFLTSSFDGKKYLTSNESNPALTTLTKKNGSLSNFGVFIKNQINKLMEIPGEEDIQEENKVPSESKVKEMNHLTLYDKVLNSNRTVDSLWRFESNGSQDQEITFGENTSQSFEQMFFKKYR